MIKHLIHSEINKTKWDSCISNSRNGLVYGMSWYLDYVCPGWEALVEDDYKTVMPLTWRKKYGIYYLFQPHFAQQLGIFSELKISKSTLELFLNAIPPKFRFIEINLNTENSFLISETKFSGFSRGKNLNFELALNKKYESVYRAYSENAKRNLRKSIKSGVNVSIGSTGISELIHLFRENKGKEFLKLKNEYYDLLKSLIAAAKIKNMVKIYHAFNHENKLCAGAVFLLFKERGIFLFSAIGNEGKNNGAMFSIIDRFIFEHSETMTTLDFEGSNEMSLARFYKSFGAKECVYLQIKKNNLPKYIQWLKK